MKKKSLKVSEVEKKIIKLDINISCPFDQLYY